MSGETVITCLVLPAFAEACAELRDHYAVVDTRVRVLVDRRHGELVPPPGADRRRAAIPRRLPPPPAGLARRAGPLRALQHLVGVAAGAGAQTEDEVVSAVRGRAPGAASELFWRVHGRIHSRLRFVLADADARGVDGAVALAFGGALDALEYGDPGLAFADILPAQIDAAAEAAAQRRDAGELPDGGLGVRDPALDEPVAVGPSDPQTATRARTERGRLLRLLGQLAVGVEHIGATAVPGADGRDIVDFLITVPDWPAPAALIEALTAAGYEDGGDAGVGGRRYLRRRVGGGVDLHVVRDAGALQADALALRDYLRRNPSELDRWNQVRRDAARIAPGSALRYFDLRRLALEELLEGSRLPPVRA